MTSKDGTQRYEKHTIIPPCQSNDVVKVALDHNRLLQYLTYLKSTDESIFQHLREIMTKLLTIDEHSERLDQIDLNLKVFDLKFEEVSANFGKHIARIEACELKEKGLGDEIEDVKNQSLNVFTKMAELEAGQEIQNKKNVEISNAIETLDKNIKSQIEETNLNVSKMNTNILYNITPQLEKCKDGIESVDIKCNDLVKQIKQLLSLDDQLKKFKENVNGQMLAIFDESKNNNNIIATRFEEAEKNILELLEKTKELEMKNTILTKQVTNLTTQISLQEANMSPRKRNVDEPTPSVTQQQQIKLETLVSVAEFTEAKKIMDINHKRGNDNHNDIEELKKDLDRLQKTVNRIETQNKKELTKLKEAMKNMISNNDATNTIHNESVIVTQNDSPRRDENISPIISPKTKNKKVSIDATPKVISLRKEEVIVESDKENEEENDDLGLKAFEERQKQLEIENQRKKKEKEERITKEEEKRKKILEKLERENKKLEMEEKMKKEKEDNDEEEPNYNQNEDKEVQESVESDKPVKKIVEKKELKIKEKKRENLEEKKMTDIEDKDEEVVERKDDAKKSSIKKSPVKNENNIVPVFDENMMGSEESVEDKSDEVDPAEFEKKRVKRQNSILLLQRKKSLQIEYKDNNYEELPKFKSTKFDVIDNDTKELLLGAINSLEDADKKIQESVQLKLNKADFEKLYKDLEHNLTKSINDVIEKIAVIDKKYKKRLEQYTFDKYLEDVGEEVFTNAVAMIVNRQLEKDANIARLSEGITNIRADITSMEKSNDKMNDMLLSSMVKEKKDFTDLLSKLDNTSNDFTEKIKVLNTRIKQIEGSDSVNGDEKVVASSDLTQAKSIRDIIKSVTMNNKIYNDQVERIQGKVEAQANEIFFKVKKELGSEASKALDTFKDDVKGTFGDINSLLSKKIDKQKAVKLNEQLNDLIQQEMHKKLDKSELKSNNNHIKKKLEDLENKISKILVDTVIELHNDDAPLVVRNLSKNSGGGMFDKCMSCNQLVKNEGEVDYHKLNSSYHSDNEGSKIQNPNPSVILQGKKPSLNKLNNTSIKLGAGGYSRYLGNLNTNLQEELQKDSQLSSNLAKAIIKGNQTPLEQQHSRANSQGIKYEKLLKTSIDKDREISATSSQLNSNRRINPKKFTNPNSNEETIEEYLRNEINSELSKPMIKPSNILKSANKAFQMQMINKKTNT